MEAVTVTDEDIKDAEQAATIIAIKLLKEHQDAKKSLNVNIAGKILDPPKLKQASHLQPRRRKKSRK